MSNSKSAKRILFVIPSLKYGGAEIFLLRLVSAIGKNVKTLVVVIGVREGLSSDFAKKGIDVSYLGLVHRGQFVRAIRGLRKIVHDFQPDAVQSLLYYADFLATFSTFPFNSKKLYWSFRGSSLPEGNSFLKKIALSMNVILSRSLPLRIVACSEQVRDFHQQIGFPQKKITVIPNFLSEWVFQETLSTSNLLSQEYPNFLNIGLAARFDPGKGHVELVKACAELLRIESRLLGIGLSFAGKGCEVGGRLHSEILLLPVSLEKIHFRFNGILEPHEMLPWYQEIDLYVMPSNGLEGFPNSLSEAVALGVPAIATNYGSAVDFVGEKRIINEPSPNAIRKAMTELLDEPISQRIFDTKNRAKNMQESYSKDVVLPLFLKFWSKE
jgi:glycosyltransferase involved in cell wall biosynthesis